MRITTLILAAALGACSGGAPVEYPVNTISGSAPAQGPFQPNANLFACNLTIANRPSTMRSGQIQGYSPLIVVRGVVLASAPANDVCLTSGFGPRGGRAHKGIDLQSRPAGTIYSAAPGTILEVSVQSGFGNQVLIDHGNGVYTRYAHLAYFAPALAPGQKVGFGVPLGMMGQSGNATAVHVHYEILTGTYDTPQKSWGLVANDPLDFPAWSGLGGMS